MADIVEIYVKNRKALDSEERRLVTSDMDTRMVYKINHSDEELFRNQAFANGTIGTFSDAYIMLAICSMGIASMKSIELFLEAIAKKHPDLSIVTENGKGIIEDRVRILSNYSYFVKLVVAKNDSKKRKEQLTFYSATSIAVTECNQRLNKDISENKGITRMPTSNIIGWGCATYVSVVMAQSYNFALFLDRRIKAPQIGNFFFANELKFKKDKHNYMVAVHPSYIEFNRNINTEEDYEFFVAKKVRAFKAYIGYRCGNRDDASAYVVIVVRDNDDMDDMAGYLVRYMEKEFLNRILFTGEGPVNRAIRDSERAGREKYDIKDAFIGISSEGDGEYSFGPVTPEFL